MTKTDKPMVIDNHCHISSLEAQDVVEGYDMKKKYGMSHRDNLSHMDGVGVDMQVLHCSRPWFHPYHRRVIKEYPDRFLAMCKLDESYCTTDEELERLRMYVEDWGFHGLYFDPWTHAVRREMGRDPAEWGDPDPFFHFDAPRFRPLWELVDSLKVPVCLVSYADNFDTLWPAANSLLDQFPDLTLVMIHGIDPRSGRVLKEDGSVELPESAIRLVNEHERVWIEVLPGLEYYLSRPPWPAKPEQVEHQSRYGPNEEIVKAFYDTFGPSKLLWGTEWSHVGLPTVENYQRQFDYLKVHCPYMTERDLELIRGENARVVYGL